ncbi:glycoside hydrolase/phage tail family protein [Paracoccus sp. Z118]|uniref:baseplate multidomain protein megatron n=1 Tax=Paracoccus sp. Z118 TaxID=2851017 RepID=UPI001C2B9C15|nr:glycoside hydrolase/phage tail family protein [Paracoccus sp. Z118]MBV0891943.1 glycoside hydrolase/phage tail family protein [Paracoccus sp. Z118]
MATILLAAAGASIGAGFGGTVLGLSGAVIGRAVGATLGRVIDERLLGAGARPVETGRIDRLRLQTAGEGTAIPRVWGQMRVPGHVIWAAPVTEVSRSSGGGKGGGGPRVTQVSYRLSFALALCEGPILGVGRVWADGEEVAADELGMRVYPGDEAQLPDACIAAHEGEDAPAYRGVAYVVMEELGLERWGNRVPQLSFEVTRAAGAGLSQDVQAVALIPGTGEYALATSQVSHDLGLGETRIVNRNTPAGGTDMEVSLAALSRELPRVGSVSLVVSWFGDDLRAGHCTLRPKVEQKESDGEGMPWRSGGIGREEAQTVARANGRPIYGGTPADDSVVEALRAIAAGGRKAVFYPFILMEQMKGNGLPDPLTGTGEQAVMPWRGRITCDFRNVLSARAEAEVEAFFGRAAPGDFAVRDGRVVYAGPDEWSYRRFILHYAHLCALAGGVDAFLIGSEMIGLTQIRGQGGSYPAVAALRALAADVRAILGPGVKLSYAADWSEYFGHHPGGAEVRFHLDPLWADENIDFVGIDNYMPLSDWRDGDSHIDASFGRIDDPDYLRGNVCGGEYFDWYYASDPARDHQRRTPITDGLGEPWLWRCKDIRGWWENAHHERIGGVRQQAPTAWVPGSKPVWFTEYGCAALDKGTDQPNKFLDAMSSESSLPWYSDGRRDDALQAAYVRAVTEYWGDPANNPAMPGGGRMVDLSRAHVWAWDARPYPAFPGRDDLWSDGPAWERGHWLNGRAGAVPLAALVAAICREAGVTAYDVSGLSGVVRGYAVQGGQTGRSALQPLMLAYGFDGAERDGVLRFFMRTGRVAANVGADDLAAAEGLAGVEITRAPSPELVGRVRLSHIAAGGDHATATAEALLPGQDQAVASDSELPLVLARGEGLDVAERWLAEAGVTRDRLRLALPPSRAELGPGDVIALGDGPGTGQRWRIDRVERAGALLIDAVRVEPGVYRPAARPPEGEAVRRYQPPVPVWPLFLDLPLLRGDEVEHAPWLAATATPWPGTVSAWGSAEENGGWVPNLNLPVPAIMGVTQAPLARAKAGIWDRGPALRVRLRGGALRSISDAGLMAGGNLLAIGDGSPDGWELMQFADAVPVGPGLWEISRRLRGQAGTDAAMRDVWPAGSVVVLIDEALRQMTLPPTARGQMRWWRIGPATRPPEDPSYRQLGHAFAGLGLRPLSPCHLRAHGRDLRWIRRTRIGGDGWDGLDVPLGEAVERYLVRLTRDGSVIWQEVVDWAACSVPADVWARARQNGPFAAEVAQLSDQFGAGPFARRMIDV